MGRAHRFPHLFSLPLTFTLLQDTVCRARSELVAEYLLLNDLFAGVRGAPLLFERWVIQYLGPCGSPLIWPRIFALINSMTRSFTPLAYPRCPAAFIAANRHARRVHRWCCGKRASSPKDMLT